ncbi:protein MIZU-KUSSEI 1-like [Cucumis melo var. makuwa]|uniref:Protein MIZU-KUSSEI 1-like n=1 Tax=Cucumis melo var. makuwa TaxID=1194695 RepID=A0A5D3BMI5_CUCMM|nr:protein MIZU-KUSSEI 1-like [Cucumis melo var. makuwa]
MANSSSHDSFSFSKRYNNYFNFNKNTKHNHNQHQEEEDDHHQILTLNPPKHKHTTVASVSKLRSAIALSFGIRTRSCRVLGTIFGHRRGHVHFSVQTEGSAKPMFLVELAMPTTALVREMASGVARIALECERGEKKKKKGELNEEGIWRAYCNGKKYGIAHRFECGAEEWRILRAVGPITVGAGVLPGIEEGGGEGEVMFMRARFERVVGSKDSEAFYMINPDGVGGPELSIFLLRV